MQIGDLVEIGWNGKKKRPFIGVVVSLTYTGSNNTGYIMVDGKMQYADLDKLRKVVDVTREPDIEFSHSRNWVGCIKE